MSNLKWSFIINELKEKVLHSIKKDVLSVKEAWEEYWVTPRAIYNWLRKDTSSNWWNNSELKEIKRLKKDKEDLLLIIWELTAELNKTKKRNKDKKKVEIRFS